jgi:predicted metal-dependent phosphoesterase TrpH
MHRVIDLHTHSALSDGTDAPGRVAELAAEAGCSAFALTDHDNQSGLKEAATRAAELGVRLVPGCEVSCKWSGGSMHVLVYFVDAGTEPLAGELERLRSDRRQRNLKMLERLSELGIQVSFERLVELAGGEEGIGRPHFATALVEAGVATNTDDAFDRFLAQGRAAYVPKARISPEDVARIARDSGGIAVLAHPLFLGLDPGDLRSLVSGLANAGFGGIEAYYSRFTPEERGSLVSLARELGLVPTGGSDYHGSNKPGLSVGIGEGDLEVPDSVLEELEARVA